jgi:NlpC/P60 family putative phage cell wall peptidase
MSPDAKAFPGEVETGSPSGNATSRGLAFPGEVETGSPSGNATRQRIIAAALQWRGTPYRHQASTLGAGCDCLGLVRGVWRTLYGGEPVAMPPYRADWRDPHGTASLQAAAERFLLPAAAIAPGVVVLFRLHRTQPPRHCAIMIAPHRFVHSQEHTGVVEAALSPSWRRRVAGTYRFP